MTLATVNPVRDRLAEVLSSWKTWSLALVEPPKLIKPLAEGTTNFSYLIQVNRRSYGSYGLGLPSPPRKELLALRLNSEQSEELGIDRNWEQLLLESLAPQNIAPQIRYSDKQGEFTLFNFVEGRVWTRNDFTRLSQREHLLELISRIQRVRLKAPRYDYVEQVDRYYQGVLKSGKTLSTALQRSLQDFREELMDFMRQPWSPVLCHHDIIPENVLETDKGLFLLDWEYAGFGHPKFDERYMRQCINGNFQRSPASLLRGDTLDKLIYWLSLLWYEFNAL